MAKSVTQFSAAFEKEHGLLFLAARMVNIVKDTVISDFLSENSPSRYKRNIRVAKYFLPRHIICKSIDDINEEETGSAMYEVPQLDDGTLFSSSTGEGPLLDRAASQYV